jgi:hypothetical protein
VRKKSDACGDLLPQKRNQSGRRCRSSGVDDGAEQHAALRACSGKGALDARSAAGMRHFLLIAKHRASLRANRAVADSVECARTVRAIDGARLHAWMCEGLYAGILHPASIAGCTYAWQSERQL